MKNTILSVAILTILCAVARPAAAEEAAPAEAAVKLPVQSDLPKAEKVEPKAEAPVAKPEPKPEPKPAPKPEAKAEAPARTEPAAEEAPAPKPAPKAAPKAEAPKKPVEPVKELNASAKVFVPLADAYKKAYEEMQRWILAIDAETATVSSNISRIQDEIQKNEAAITKLKLSGGSESSQEGRELSKENKQLWSDLNAARKERSALTKGFVREAIQRAKSNQVEIIEKLEEIKSQPK